MHSHKNTEEERGYPLMRVKYICTIISISYQLWDARVARALTEVDACEKRSECIEREKAEVSAPREYIQMKKKLGIMYWGEKQQARYKSEKEKECE